MDNASKALIMAGAILIAVMLISLGVMLFNTGSDIAQRANRSTANTAIQAHNREFEIYFTGADETTTAAQVNSLLSLVRAYKYNTESVGEFGDITVSINGDDSNKALNTKVSNSTRYTVEGTYAETGEYAGCVDTITINATKAPAGGGTPT